MLCPSCFEDKGPARHCAACGFDEQWDGSPRRFLPYRHALRDGRYVVGCELGKPGGFGVAYKALDTRQRALVVVKECLLTEHNHVSREPGKLRVEVNPGYEQEYRRWLDRFHKEAARISKFTSPYIVRVTEVFEENNTSYYVMPFVEGQDLKHYTAERGGRLPPDEVAQIARKLLMALSEIHSIGYLHRDIKPSNVLITKNKCKPVLIDFGAAHDGVDQDRSYQPYTPQFAPIEQALGRTDEQGPWTDMYALSATLYQCLTRELPPESTARYDEQGKRPDRFIAIHGRVPNIGAGLVRFIDAGLALSPAERMRDAATALQVLDDTTSQAPQQPPPNWTAGVLAPLLPAVVLLAYGLLATPNFSHYFAGWPGLLVVANGVAWGLWFRSRRAQSAGNMFRQTTTGLGPTTIDPPPGRIRAVELRLSSAGMATQVHVVKPEQTVVVGRGGQANLIVANELVSATHVSIAVSISGEFTVKDLGSRNYTFVFVKGREGAPDQWKRIQSASGRRGRFMLGPHDGVGVLIEIRQTSVEP